MELFLLFFAFYVQFEASQDQRNEIQKQRNSWVLERFENRFFERLKLHKENVNEMEITDSLKGRRYFTNMFYEHKRIYHKLEAVVKSISKENNVDSLDIDKMILSYLVFCYGIGSNSEKSYEKRLDLKAQFIFSKLKHKLKDDQKNYRESPLTYGYQYKPYNGHANRLGHYYRCLFQTVNFIINHKDVDEQVKMEYIASSL